MKKTNFLFLLISICFMMSCTSDINDAYYESGQVGRVNKVIKGIVISARPIYVTDEADGAGSLAGAVIGGVAGSMVGGSDRANMLGAAVGGTAGAAVGSKAERAITKQSATEYVIETDSGKIMSITQGNNENLKIGQRIMVIYGSRARVIPYSGKY